MAWRIHDSVIRGEIDNRTRGRVKGKLWLHDMAEPVELDLQGNAHPDMAGCRLEFTNPAKTSPMRKDATMTSPQRGSAGDITASRKVRVPDLPFEEWWELKRAGKPAPEHWGNSLYIEWFSDRNGRVVVELADCVVKVSEQEWQMTEKDEKQRAEDASQGFADFMGKLTEAVEQAKAKVPDHEKEWDEFDHENFLRESEARTDKYGELLEKYGHGPEAEKIIAKEMGWTWLTDALEAKERGEEIEEVEEEWDAPDLDEMEEPELDPLTEGIDWVRDESGHPHHPLQARSMEAGLKLWKAVDALGIEDDDEDVAEMTFKFHQVSAKLAGALNSLCYGRGSKDEATAIVARLKRALNHLHECQAAMAKVAEKKLVPAAVMTEAGTELFAIREEILRLMPEFRSV